MCHLLYLLKNSLALQTLTLTEKDSSFGTPRWPKLMVCAVPSRGPWIRSWTQLNFISTSIHTSESWFVYNSERLVHWKVSHDYVAVHSRFTMPRLPDRDPFHTATVWESRLTIIRFSPACKWKENVGVLLVTFFNHDYSRWVLLIM